MAFGPSGKRHCEGSPKFLPINNDQRRSKSYPMSDRSERSIFHFERVGEEVRTRLLNKLLKMREEQAVAMDVDRLDDAEISADDKLADADFFNAFQDDFDDSDIK